MTPSGARMMRGIELGSGAYKISRTDYDQVQKATTKERIIPTQEWYCITANYI